VNVFVVESNLVIVDAEPYEFVNLTGNEFYGSTIDGKVYVITSPATTI
jgi:hypothetical protein